MRPPKNFGFATTDALASKRWRQLERVGRPGNSCKKPAELAPSRPSRQKLARERKSRRSLRVAAAFVAEFRTGFQTRSRHFLRESPVYRRRRALTPDLQSIPLSPLIPLSVQRRCKFATTNSSLLNRNLRFNYSSRHTCSL